MKLIGIALILNTLGLTFWWIATDQSSKGWALSVCGLAVFAGFALVFSDRLTELTVKGVGTIKAATEQVVADAKTVGDLKQRVENQSATVDLVAKQAAMAKALSEQVEEQNKRASEKLASLDKSASEARNVLNETKSLLEFTELIVAAQSDDRAAFDKLRRISEDTSSPFSGRAQQAWRTIFEAHSSPMARGGFVVPWKPGIDPAKFSLTDLEREFKQAPEQVKLALLEYIANRSDFPKVERVDFLLRILKTDANLTVAEYAGRNFTTVAGLQIKPLAIKGAEGKRRKYW